MRLVGSLLLLLLGSLAVGDACSAPEPCCGTCPSSEPAAFQLACPSTDLQSVTASGPCTMPNATLASYLGDGVVYVRSGGPGVCHVDLTFATGFTYSVDVTFASQPGGVCGGPQCSCGDYVRPTGGPFVVDDPHTTCVDSGVDGSTDAATCPSDASESAPCAVPGTCSGCRLNAGFECTCVDADSGAEGGGMQWQCVDTGYPCKPGSP
ncbi:MAG TPA: hypothetical protein VIY73_12230 [Polyangiaceae bacterium]